MKLLPAFALVVLGLAAGIGFMKFQQGRTAETAPAAAPATQIPAATGPAPAAATAEKPAERPVEKARGFKAAPSKSSQPAKQEPVTVAQSAPPPAAAPQAPASSAPPAAPQAAAPAAPPARETVPAPAAKPEPKRVTLAAGTVLSTRLIDSISSDKSHTGDTFNASLDQPIVIDGMVIAERGARVQGRVVESDPGGRVRGRASIAIELTQVATSDGQNVRVNTDAFSKEAEGSVGRDVAKVGIGSAIGAAIGAIAGGGKGAAIGAGVGGAAGGGTVLATRGKAAAIPSETRVSFRLREPVTITENLR